MEKCLICDRELLSFRGLSGHVSIIHKIDIKDYLDTYVYKGVTPKCEKCGADQVWDYPNHGHYGGCSVRCDKYDNYEECQICKLRLDDLSDLSIHVRKMHNLGFKTYLDTYVYKGIPPVCKQCGLPQVYYSGRYKDYSDKCHLLHKCYICGEHYELKHLLSRHVKYVHNISKFKDYLDNYVPGNPPKCDKCGADLAFEFGAYIDKCSKRCSSSFKCSICDVGFGNRESLDRHILSAHKIKVRDYVDKYVWNDSPPKCEKCGEISVFYKGQYRDWCSKCNPYHAYQRCKRGWFESEKVINNKFYYRSSHELVACQLLDKDPNVKHFCNGPTIFMDDGTNYIMDFYTIMMNGSTKLIEVKPEHLVMDALIQRKIKAASLYAKDNCIDEVVFWTEKNLYSKGV